VGPQGGGGDKAPESFRETWVLFMMMMMMMIMMMKMEKREKVEKGG
jgi:hypothetical protein